MKAPTPQPGGSPQSWQRLPLGVGSNASLSDICSAFVARAMPAHPDSGGSDGLLQQVLLALEDTLVATTSGAAGLKSNDAMSHATTERSSRPSARAAMLLNASPLEKGSSCEPVAPLSGLRPQQCQPASPITGGMRAKVVSSPVSGPTASNLSRSPLATLICPDKPPQLERLLSKLQHLLRGLPPDRRRHVLLSKFSREQRSALEQWMLAHPRVQPPRAAKVTKKAPKTTTQAVHRRQRVQGIVRLICLGRYRYYYALANFAGLQLQTTTHRDLATVLTFHVALTALKHRVVAATEAPASQFDLRLAAALETTLAELGLDTEGLGLRLRVVLSALWTTRRLRTRSFKVPAELTAGLQVWHRLREAKGAAMAPGCRGALAAATPEDLERRWHTLRDEYLQVVADVGIKEMMEPCFRQERMACVKLCNGRTPNLPTEGKSPAAVTAATATGRRLLWMDCHRQTRQERQLERWNQARMLAEEKHQRQCLAKQWQQKQQQQKQKLQLLQPPPCATTIVGPSVGLCAARVEARIQQLLAAWASPSAGSKRKRPRAAMPKAWSTKPGPRCSGEAATAK